MPKVAKPLTAIEVKRLTEPGYHAVGTVPGLMLRIQTEGSGGGWVLNTTIKGKRVELGGLGSYPEVSLAQAIEKARQIKDEIRKGVDPREQRRAAQRAEKQAFRAVATDYIEAHRAGWRNAKHAQQWTNTLETYAYPVIGAKHVQDVGIADVLAVLRPIWVEKNETATRVRNRIELVLSYAMALGYRESGLNPASWRGNMDQVLPRPSKVSRVEHHPAVPYAEAGAFLGRLRASSGMGARCLEFVLMTACRSGEARLAQWSEFDLVAGVWSIPSERMKAGRPHRVPLSEAVLELLHELPRLVDKDGKPLPLVFSGMKGGQPLSDMTLTAVMRRMGLDAVPHGLRSTFRDWAAETTGYPGEVVEMALAHAVGSATEAAYRRGDLFEKRRELMDSWARYVTQPGANVVQLRAA